MKRKTKGNGSLQKKLVVRLLLVFFLPMMLISVYTLSIQNRMLYQNTLSSAETMLGTAEREIRFDLQSCVDQLSQLAGDASILSWLSSRTVGDVSTVHMILDQLAPFRQQMQVQNQSLRALRIIHTNPGIFNAMEWVYLMERESDLLSLLKTDKGVQRYTVSYLPRDRSWAVGARSAVWCVDYAIMGQDGMLLGVAEITLDHRAVWGAAVEGLKESGYEFFLLYEGEEIASTGQAVHEGATEAKEGVTDQDGGVLVKRRLGNTGAMICVWIPKGMMSLSPEKLMPVAAVLLAVLLLSWLMVRAVCQSQLRGLNRLVDRMDEVAGVNLGDQTGEDDVQRMSRHFEGMYARLNEDHRREKQLLYDDLTNELRPHFICNMMDQLRLQAERLKQEELAESIVHINQYFRYSMLGKDDLVTLGEEVENALNYLKLANVMRTDKITFDVSLDSWAEAHLTEAKVPRLLLQPLLENAVRHGIGKLRGGNVFLSVKREGKATVLTVEDNGSGIPREETERLNALFGNAEKAENGRHLGLLNVKRRLNLVFTGRNSLRISSTPYEGTAVTIRMEDPETEEEKA